MIEALTIPAILLALANGIRQWRAMRERRPQRDEVQQLLALLCERLPERLERDGAPPRTVINLTAGQMAGGQQAMTDDIGLRLRRLPLQPLGRHQRRRSAMIFCCPILSLGLSAGLATAIRCRRSSLADLLPLSRRQVDDGARWRAVPLQPLV